MKCTIFYLELYFSYSVEVLKMSPMIEMNRRTPKSASPYPAVEPMPSFDDIDDVLPPVAKTGELVFYSVYPTTTLFCKPFVLGLSVYCEAVELSDRPRQKGKTNTSRTLDPLIEIVSTT